MASLLVIDDNPNDVHVLVELLRDQNFRIIVSLNGNDGFHKAVEYQPNLILLDRMMPDIDGLQVCKLLKSDHRTCNIPIIFLTALESVEDKVLGFSLGICDYITKPWHVDEVVARIRAHIDIHRRLQPQISNTVPDMVFNTTDRAELRVQKAQTLCSKKLEADWLLGELAKQIGTHGRQLADDFRLVTGQSWQKWLRNKRLQHASHFLLTTNEDISIIAEQVGYKSAAAFSNVFRENFGVTPSEYRKMLGLSEFDKLND